MGSVLADKPVVGRGVQWTLQTFQNFLRATSATPEAGEQRVRKLWLQLCRASRDAVAAVASQKSMRAYPNVPRRHFQHLGLDVVLDADDHVWLCECNDTPGLESWRSWATTEHPDLPETDLAALALAGDGNDDACRTMLRDSIALLGVDGGDDGHGEGPRSDVTRFFALFGDDAP